MSKQYEWDININNNGNLNKLTEIAQYGVASTDYFRIFGGIDEANDCPGQDFGFDSIYFENKSKNDADEVHRIANELLDLFNGACRLTKKGYSNITINSIFFGKENLQISDELGDHFFLEIPENREYSYNNDLEQAFDSSLEQGLLVLAIGDEDVYDVLKHLREEASWVNFYKVLETLDRSLKSKNMSVFKKGTNERNRFDNAANNYSYTKYESRHAKKIPNGKVNKTYPMSTSEAHDFIYSVCKDYFHRIHDIEMPNVPREKRSLSVDDLDLGDMSKFVL